LTQAAASIAIASWWRRDSSFGNPLEDHPSEGSNHSNVGKAMPSMPFAPSPRKITIFIGGINLNHSQSWAVYGIVLTIVTTVSMSGMR